MARAYSSPSCDSRPTLRAWSWARHGAGEKDPGTARRQRRGLDRSSRRLQDAQRGPDGGMSTAAARFVGRRRYGWMQTDTRTHLMCLRRLREIWTVASGATQHSVWSSPEPTGEWLRVAERPRAPQPVREPRGSGAAAADIDHGIVNNHGRSPWLCPAHQRGARRYFGAITGGAIELAAGSEWFRSWGAKI